MNGQPIDDDSATRCLISSFFRISLHHSSPTCISPSPSGLEWASPVKGLCSALLLLLITLGIDTSHSGGCLRGVGAAEQRVAWSASVRTSPSIHLGRGSSAQGHRSSMRANALRGGAQGGKSVPTNTGQTDAVWVRKTGMRGLDGGRRQRDGRSASKAGVVFLVLRWPPRVGWSGGRSAPFLPRGALLNPLPPISTE